MSIRASSWCRNAQAQAVAQIVTGGACLICSGKRPEINVAPTAEQVIAKIFVPAQSIKVDGSTVTIQGPIEALAKIPGIAQWFRLIMSDGKSILDGTIGRIGSGKKNIDMLMTRVDLLAGDSVMVERIAVCAKED